MYMENVCDVYEREYMFSEHIITKCLNDKDINELLKKGILVFYTEIHQNDIIISFVSSTILLYCRSMDHCISQFIGFFGQLGKSKILVYNRI